MKNKNESSANNRSSWNSIIYILCLLAALQINGFSQTSGKLVGRVTDQNGEPLIGANVILDGTNMGAASDIEGYYSIINVRAGTYKIRFRFLGYKAQVVE